MLSDEHTGPQIVRADRATRRRAIGWALLAVLAGTACLLFLTSVLAELDGLAEHSPELATARAATILQVALAIGVGFALLAAGWIARLSTRILEAGQYPLPGARLTRDTRLRRGSAARRVAWLGFVCAAVLVLAATGLLATGWRLLEMLAGA